MPINYKNLYRKPLFRFFLIACIVTLFYYYPNIFLPGAALYKIGVFRYNQGEHEDWEDGGKMKSAAFYFEKAIYNGYHERNVFTYLFISYYRSGEKENLDENLERICTLGIEHYPKDDEFHYRRGESRVSLKNFKGAFDDFDDVIKFNQKSPFIKDAYFDRGAMSYLLGDTASANLDRLTVKKLSGFDWRTYEEYCRNVWNIEPVSK